ncbi:DsbA family oxidoreductase [Teredinibacter haidensis]|uniref:DsbA family oxidoreductase n=1 Tax=Teredinibacter haidensis TaxID=2731755 RepID=UPI000948C563|nr:DsbA family protein [Teredinibacter haidensis]
MSKIQIDHFSDVLCIWAYVSQIRVDELISEFGDKVEVAFHFFPVFGDVPGKIEKNWSHRGGVKAYSSHVQSVADKFDHVSIHPDVWVKNTPQSSLPAHLFLSAAKMAEANGEAKAGSFLHFMQKVREAFFVDARDISNRMELLAITEQAGLPIAVIREAVDSGRAHSMICGNMHHSVDLGIQSSPTLIFNEGRQKLSGNVGYRIIEANIRELLENPAGQQSWC